ncbi:spore gernimation protein GerPD [Oceanobacillus arenosus]|uniref:Spore gernimation protein GerPD n=1 Tax=Oceanobacillus arenosus TaxID=1229153 RepID=A0A3D8PSI7_9BACI|nr:spore gernimation protein GerPD [Oceanobacillus arenosus]RDW18241.1 spore gernimation protein GerPD [Oceanobacillus arenosus]
MNIEVHNWGINVGNIQVEVVGSSSVLLIGDNEQICLSSFFDTPPESFTFGNIIPLAP